MVIRYEAPETPRTRIKQRNIKADIIVLGCTLPGIVTAHKLKQKFGKSINIVVLDLNTTTIRRRVSMSRLNVAFEQNNEEDEYYDDKRFTAERTIFDNVARHYMAQFARDFKLPLPESIFAPVKVQSPYSKLFQFIDGRTVICPKDYHDFLYLGYIERFELEQYQNLLDQNMRNLFHVQDSLQERQRLLYFDQTTMETHLSQSLYCTTSRDIMRATVSLVCGASAEEISVLFYLHQCYRSNSSRNHLGGDNTRFREKLMGYCRKRLSHNLQQSIADITLIAKPIREIRTCSDERVILKTMLGETNYVCNLLAMALRPDQLKTIQFGSELLSGRNADVAKAMKPGIVKKFQIQYEENFWNQDGYSGDILSIKGPIIWAMERPDTSATGRTNKYAALIGYLKVEDTCDQDSKDAVISQLVQLFGMEAANPLRYKESTITDVYIPRNGDYIALRKLIGDQSTKYICWGAFDVFADGDVAAALEAGHTAYLHMLSILRPQATTFDDVVATGHPIILPGSPLDEFLASLNVMSFIKMAVISCSVLFGIQMIRYMRK